MAGRPRQFDEELVLEWVMNAFWRNGFAATTMADIVTATGLHKGSLYKAFGSKQMLFIRALTRYLEDMQAMGQDMMATADTPLDSIRAVLHGMLDIADDDPECPKGCLAINSLVELVPHDPDVRAVMDKHMGQIQNIITEVVRQAQTAGQVSDQRPPELITMLMLTFMSGLATHLKAHYSKEEGHQMLDAQLEALI